MKNVIGIFRRKDNKSSWNRLMATGGTYRTVNAYQTAWPDYEVGLFEYEGSNMTFTKKMQDSMKRVS